MNIDTFRSRSYLFEFHCKESENSFIRTTKGAYCTKCSEQVLDLTDLNDDQLCELLRNKSESVCASFYKSSDLITSSKSTLAGFSLLALLASSAPMSAHSQVNHTELTDSTTVSDNLENQAATIATESDTTCREHFTPMRVDEQDRELKYKRAFHIGSWHVFIKNKFPWISIKRLVMGRLRRR